MFKITVLDQDREEHTYETVDSYSFMSGALQLYHADGSMTIYAPEAWLEIDIEPKVEDYQV